MSEGRVKPFQLIKEISRVEKLRIKEKVSKPQKALGPDLKGLSWLQVIPPKDDGAPMEHFTLMELLYDTALPRLLSVMEIYPPTAYITIGQSQDPRFREVGGYSVDPRYIQRPANVPLEQHILYRSNSHFNVLLAEYIFQFHISEGAWKESFKGRTNPQKKLFPQFKPASKKSTLKPHYVYVQFSTQPATTSTK